MAIAIIQVIGVFIATLFGVPSILRAMHKLGVPAINFIAIAIGVAMATCGIFF